MEDQGHAAWPSWPEIERRICDRVRDLSDAELGERIALLAEAHGRLCSLRWAIFDRIDVLSEERCRRIRASIEEVGVDQWVQDALDGAPPGGRRGRLAGTRRSRVSWPPLRPLPPLHGLPTPSLRALLADEHALETDVSARRQLLWGWLRILVAEQDMRTG